MDAREFGAELAASGDILLCLRLRKKKEKLFDQF
jgi:hypothetical protein